MSNKKLVGFTIATAAALTFGIAPMTSTFAQENTEKCYGIVKAGMNDCATATQSCAGSATKDRQPDAYLFVPKGVCEKIAGGMPKPKEDSKT